MTSLEDKLRATVLATELEGQKESGSHYFREGLAWGSAALLAACMAMFLILSHKPVDSFDDPGLAYAEVEKAFDLIGQKIEKGSEIVLYAEEPVETIKTIFE